MQFAPGYTICLIKDHEFSGYLVREKRNYSWCLSWQMVLLASSTHQIQRVGRRPVGDGIVGVERIGEAKLLVRLG